MIEDPLPQSLRRRSLVALLLAMFAIAVGDGFQLPILPSLIARVGGTAEPGVLAWHTGILKVTYRLALFLFAPLWGCLSDRYGRQPLIVIGLVGFASTLVMFAMAGSLSSEAGTCLRAARTPILQSL